MILPSEKLHVAFRISACVKAVLSKRMTLIVSDNHGDELLELEARSPRYLMSGSRYPSGSSGPFTMEQTISVKTPHTKKAKIRTRKTKNAGNFLRPSEFLNGLGEDPFGDLPINSGRTKFGSPR
ncbi:hypothetical protein PanWU01x14_092320 [Parasponia andersonii]|uniref:Uncharacterized protein n=1 Tax=Parasponia andersonii TaxID=3476 RepID=A0A2P5D6J4_PARAD|nr:hypothetical protein PanWU01x14_092320 [Parasponia andersonii]